MKINGLNALALAAASVAALTLSAAAATDARERFEHSVPTAKMEPQAAERAVPNGESRTASPATVAQNKPSVGRYADLVHVQPYAGVPATGVPKSGNCGPDNDGDGRSDSVVIKVRNDGTAASGVFYTKIIFPDAGVELQMSSAGLEGPTTSGSTKKIPAAAWVAGKARFEIIIDFTNNVYEGPPSRKGESNNRLKGYCVAEAT